MNNSRPPKKIVDKNEDWHLYEQMVRCKDLRHRVHDSIVERLHNRRDEKHSRIKSMQATNELFQQGHKDGWGRMFHAGPVMVPHLAKRVTVRPVRYDVKFGCVSKAIHATKHDVEVTSVKNWHLVHQLRKSSDDFGVEIVNEFQAGQSKATTTPSRLLPDLTPQRPSKPAAQTSRSTRRTTQEHLVNILSPHSQSSYQLISPRAPPRGGGSNHYNHHASLLSTSNTQITLDRYKVSIASFLSDYFLVSHGKFHVMREALMSLLNRGIANMPCGSGRVVQVQMLLDHSYEVSKDEAISLYDVFHIAYNNAPAEMKDMFDTEWDWLKGLKSQTAENVFSAYHVTADSTLHGVTFETMAKNLMNLKAVPVEDLKAVFDKYDEDKDGVLNLKEFEKLMHGYF